MQKYKVLGYDYSEDGLLKGSSPRVKKWKDKWRMKYGSYRVICCG
jgi:mRNA-degrading endonuclease RelE of RelBE toxin-antitoxin system